ncbi:MAG: ESPR-type extended signal peptide-containing protein [Acidaminococcus fermentans]|nr:ESPR-type extended signal peptide-containing protein [Acidaminococcus fermentans]
MNKIYKVIWSRVRHCYVVVSELAKRAGKEKSTCLSTAGKTAAALGLGAVLLMGSPCSEAFAATGNKVIGGSQTAVTDDKGKTDQAEATGDYSTVSGGELNHANGNYSSVSGGSKNHATGESSSVSGGGDNIASGTKSSISGGKQNKATGEFSSISGGDQNEAAGNQSTISGGTANKTTGDWSTIVGGAYNLASGNSSLALGGMYSAVQGMYSVGIAGGSTSAAAMQGFAAGYQSAVNVAYGTAIGYQAVANTRGTISFGHVKGDTYYAADPWDHTIGTNTFDDNYYNRLVNVADGIDAHDVVVMEQLTAAKAEAVATAKNQIKVKGDEKNVHAVEATDSDGVQTTTISLLPKVTLQDSTDTTGSKAVVLDGTAGTISAGLSTDAANYISLNGTTGQAQVGAVKIGKQDFTYTYDRPDGMNDDGTVKLTSTRANANGTFVTGLSNKTWTPGNYVTGRAATEDQLEQAGRHFLSIKTAYVDGDGNPITPVAENTLANYYNDGATGSASMAFGVGTTAQGNLSLAMGVNSAASGLNSLAIGYGNKAAGTQSVAVGNSSNASGNYSVAMGLGAQAGTKNTDVESTDHGGAVAVGYGAGAAETGSAAYGYSATAGAVESSAFGTSAQANTEGSIALGAHSVANREKGTTGYLAPDMTNPQNAANAATWVSTSGAVSLGGTDAEGRTISRQITNLAAGTNDSDAVNVAQLKAVESKGLNFQGNDTTTSVHLNQGGTLQIQGSGRKADTEYSAQNIKVLMDTANNRLSIALDKNPVFASVTAGTEGTGADGGQAGSIKIVGANSSNANKATTITAGYTAVPELSGTNGTGRLSYTDGDGTVHTVATLGDGLKLAGDTGTGSVALDNTLTVSGGATNLAAGSNIGVTANGSTLSLKLAKDITGLDTVTAGGAKLGKQTDGNDTTRSGDYLTGLDNTTWTVGQTNYVSGRAATEDQLKSVSDVVNANKTNIANNTETIGRGLNFQANTKGTDASYKTVNRALGSTVAVRAHDAQDGHTYKTDNLTTEIDDNGIITVKMDTQLTADKVTVGKDNNAITINGADGSLTTGSSTLSGTGLTINNGPSITTGGISGGNQKMTNVASGKSGDDTSGNPVYGTETNAANIGDVKKIAAKIVTVSGDNKNTKVDKTTNPDGTVDYQVSLNDSVTLGSDAAKKIALNGTAGTVSVGDKVTLNGANGTATIGGATLGKSGADTYLTGLTNKTWDGTAVSGRAATEDQLKSVSDTVNAGWNAKVGDQTLAVTPANNTLTFAAGDNIALTPTDSSKTITIATQPNVTFTTVRVGSTDGTDGIYIGSQPGGGANGSATSNITSITGLKNTAWVTDHFMSGRAATEDQLNEVAKTIKGEASASDIYVESGSVSYGNNGEGTGTLVRKNDKTTGQLTGLHDYYVTGGSVSTDGTTLNLTKNGGAAIPGIDLTNVLNQDSHLVTADSGEYTVGSDGKVTLKVKNNVAGSTPTYVVISGIASNAALRQGLNFKANAAEKTDGSDTYNAQLGRTVSVLGGAAKEKHTYNTDNITTTMDNGAITVKLDNDLTANSLTAGSNIVDGRVKVTGATGAYVEMDGSDGSIHLGNNGGRYSALYQNYGGKGFLSSETSPRLEYAVDNDPNTRHTIATLDDGMKFAGDDAKTDSTKVVSRTLNSTLNITGGAATGNLTDGNIGVVKNDAGDGLTIKLNKDLTNMGTISFAPTETGKQGIKIGSQNVGTSGKGTNAQTGDYITGLTNTKWNADDIVSGRAATEDQLQNVAKSIVNGSATGGGFGLSADNADSTKATEVKQDLGKAIKITTGGDNNLSTTVDSANKAIVVSLNKDLNLNKATFTDDTSGATTVVAGNGIAITPKNGGTDSQVKLTTDGLSNGGKQITNVQSGLYDTDQNKPVDISTIATGSSMLQNAATIGDLQTVSNGVNKALTNKGLYFKGNDGTVTVHRDLGETLTIQGTGANGRDYDGGANVQVLANKDTGTLTVQLDRDLNAHTLTLGKASTGTETGEAGTLILNGTNKDNGMSPVSIGVTYRGNKDNEVMTTAMSRITYKGGNGNDHTVATLEDGLQLSGDNGETANTTLNKKVTIKGGVTKDNLVDNSTDPTKNNNIGVIASQDSGGNTTLSLQLARDITGLNTVTAGTVVMGKQTVISDQKRSETGSFVTGLENTTWDGKDYVSGRAATEDQLKKVNDSITQVLGSGTFAITAGGRGEAVDATIEQNLGSAIRIFGDAPVTNEKNDGSGDFWDRSKANILTKVKKDHNNEDYVSVELQDHLEVGVHGDGKTIEGTDGSMQFKGKSAKEVNITGDTGIALSDNGNQAAALRQADGAGYLDLTGTTAGTKAAVSVHTGAKNLAQQEQTRLAYTDQDNKAHDVATMDDGMIFAGDTGDNVGRTLNGTVKISGGVSNTTDLSDGKNVGVIASSDGLAIKLAKNLTGIDSITGLKNITIGPDFATQGRAATEEQLKAAMGSVTNVSNGGGFGLTADKANASGKSDVKQDLGGTIGIHGDSNITTSVSKDGKSIDIKLNNQVDLGTYGSLNAGGVTIDSKGIDAGGKKITNVASGIVNKDDSDNTNAANIGDVKTLAGKAAKSEIGKLGKREFAGDDGATVSRGLGESMKLSGGADTSKLTNGNIGVVRNAAGNGLDIRLSSELTGLTSVTTGNSTLNSDGLTVNNSDGQAGTTVTSSGIKIASDGEGTHAVEVSNGNVSMGGQQIHDVAPGTKPTDAVNVSQLGGVVSGVSNAITRLDSRVDRVGAGASALAALHPLEFDPEDKLNFAAGFGHYRSANAAAIGAFYQPTESVRFNVGGSFGGGENMVNAGVTFSLDPQRRDRFQSRIVLMRTVQQLRSDNDALRQDNQKVHAQLDAMNDRLNQLTALVEQLSARK